jgi:hypothetical protein
MKKSKKARLLAIALVLAASGAEAAPRCFEAFGVFKQRQIAGNPCNSPLRQCQVATFTGVLQGTALNSVTRVAGTPDFPITGVLGGTSDGEFEGRVLNRRGGLTVKYAALIDGVGRGDSVSMMTIIGGSGQLSGATGTLRFSTVFDLEAAEVSSKYEGQICLPN